MLHIIIFILKIIGILLLVILGLILLLVSSVLFVPITYKVRAERKDGVIQVRAVAGWMFRLLSVHYRLHTSQEPMQLLQGRILGIPVWKPLEPKKEKPKKAEKKSKEKQSKPKQMGAKQLEQKAEVKSSDKAKERLKKDLTPGTAVASVPQPEPEVSRQEQPQDKQAQTKPPRQSILKKLLYAIRRIYGKITAIGRGLFSLVVKLLHMPEKASETIGTLTDFWNLEENVKARESIWRELKFLWKHSRPRKADLTLHFGFEDPSWTGQCMGVLSILNVWYPGRIFLKPEFEQEIFEGTLYIKGHMMLAVPLLSIFRLWRDENVMKMYRRFRQ
ncbi:hypothetical protein DWZ08_03995 [Clostridiaceae bacterium AF29-16BH]|nr:hypothetical protein DWZ37_15245 [Clostridiaceae bacterium AF31-3BH]RHQ26129.1 hypothetical protein DWZ08_03995 [Clostridiaceae bacterium AF29-16BH]